MNITIDQLMAKIGRLHVSQDLLVEENAVLKDAAKVKDVIKVEIEKLESEGESVAVNVIARLKALL
jgi:hypothetical protein